MPTVTNTCDEGECPHNLHKYPWCTTLWYSHGYFCYFFIELNTLVSGTMTSKAQLFKSEWQVRLRIIIKLQHCHGLQETFCKAEQDCFGSLEKDWDSMFNKTTVKTFINASFPVQQNVHITYTWYKEVTNIISWCSKVLLVEVIL
jgi:Fe-S cluster assembly iron-binding protein IscA